MKVFVALVWREIAERRLLLLASLLLGLVPVILPWIPGSPGSSTPEEIRTAAALALAALFGGATLLMLGSTIIGRDLSDRRLSFYFSRPIGSWTLWLSRLAAALLLLVAVVLLLVLPSAVADAGSWLEELSDSRGDHAWPVLGFGEMFFSYHIASSHADRSSLPGELSFVLRLAYVLFVLGLLLGLAHAASTIVRSRNLWVLADLAGLATVSWLLWLARGVLVRAQAPGALIWMERLLVPAVLAALILAGGVQLARGRVDLMRGHRYLSATLWTTLIAVALAAGATSWWVAASGIQDLERLTFVRAAPGEKWLVAGGTVRHRAGARAAFLLDTDSGRSWRLGGLEISREWLTFAPDGGTVVWARCESFRPLDCELWMKDLRDPESAPRSTEIPINPWQMRWYYEGASPPLTFDHDGTLLAITENEKLIVYGMAGLSTAKEASSPSVVTAVSAEEPEAIAFLPGNRLRFHQRVATSSEVPVETGWRTEIRELDLETRQSTVTGELPPMGYSSERSPARDTLFYQSLSPHGLGLYDGATGVPLVEIKALWDYRSGWGHFLADGRLVAGHHDQGTLTLLVVSAEGQKLHQLEHPGVRKRQIGAELSPGRLLVALEEEPKPPETPRHELDVEPLTGWTTYVLDADTGTLEPLAAGIQPLGDAGTAADRLFLAGGGRVIRWDPDSGEVRTVLQL